MKTADEILKQVNDFLDNLAYDRKPESLYARYATCSLWEANASVRC